MIYASLMAHVWCFYMQTKGFTLIELMITVAVVAILASIAYPSYMNSVVKSRRGEAQSVMLDVSQRQQQYLMDLRKYAPDLATLKYTVPADVTTHYTVTLDVTQGPPPTFLLTMTPKAGGSQINDVELTVNHQGVTTPAGKW